VRSFWSDKADLERLVFLGENNSVKLGDFGLSKIIASHDFASTYVGTPFYMSPEICAAERYSSASDIWSLGCIIYELATRCVPFDAKNHVDLIRRINAGRTNPLPPRYSKELSEAIHMCLKTNPLSRPDTAQLLNIPSIKLARTRLQVELGKGLEEQLAQAQKQIQDLQLEVRKLKEHEKKLEMEWHARATLAIDQRVQEQVEAKKAELLKQFDVAVDHRAEEKLSLHLASLPASHGLQAGDSFHVRSSTPPPGKAASFATTATTGHDTDWSSMGEDLDSSALGTDLTSLSIQEERGDDVSPLAQRVKPLKKGPRGPLGRAQTYANCNRNAPANPSPMDVHMADPSPMPPHVAPMSIKGLSLSPRKNGQERLSGGAALRRDIFKEAKLRPTVKGESQPGTDTESGFADDYESDELDEDADVLLDMGDSPSRPSSGLSNHAGGDPFKALNAPRHQLKPLPRPSLARQKTMPVQMHRHTPSNNMFALRKTPEKDKENRPPSSHTRNNSGVPVISASPNRPVPHRDTKALTPSRKAPPPPVAPSNVMAKQGANLLKQIHKQSPAKIRGQTLVQLQQARSTPNLLPPDFELDIDGSEPVGGIMRNVPELPPSPAKWDVGVHGEEMPSPFLAKKYGPRTMVR
jgi:NIMA (never in mitosis gene a)-related kinase 2